jgi:hypothetical protein
MLRNRIADEIFEARSSPFSAGAFRFERKGWNMKKVVIAATVALFLTSFLVQAAKSLTCDQATLTKVEADIGSMSGKDAKKASKQLDQAKQAFKDGKMKKCTNIMKKLQASLKSTSAPAAEGTPPAEGAPPANQGDGGQGDSM